MPAWPYQRRISDRDLVRPTEMSGTAGGRDVQGKSLPVQLDSLRVRSLNYVPQGYMSQGYDTGRVW